jgi:hypothetical protein
MMMGLSLPEMEIFAVLASAGVCPVLPGPEIIVSIQHHGAEIRNDLTRAQLQDLRADMDLAYQIRGPANAEIGGLLQGDIGIQYAIDFDQIPYSTAANKLGQFCARYRRIHLVLGAKPVIYVA